jgi:hypothetical protein
MNIRVAVETTAGAELVTIGAVVGIAQPFASRTDTAIAGSVSDPTFDVVPATAKLLVRAEIVVSAVVAAPTDPVVAPALLPIG